MKSARNTFIRASFAIATIAMFFGMQTPVHAQTIGIGQIIKENIVSDKGNVIQNRDARNEILKQKDPKQIFINDLSISLSNYENIRDRIVNRADDASISGTDISSLYPILNDIDDEIDTASSTIAAFTASSTPELAQTATDDIRIIKENLQDALDTLETIIQ